MAVIRCDRVRVIRVDLEKFNVRVAGSCDRPLFYFARRMGMRKFIKGEKNEISLKKISEWKRELE
jgi:hypothetical protein